MTDSTPTIKFRGKKVHLRYPLLAFSRLQKDYGIKMDDFAAMGDSADIDMIGKLVWAGLITEFSDATVDEVLGSFELSDLPALSEALSAAFSAMSK